MLSGVKAANIHIEGRNIDAFNRKKMASEKQLIDRSEVAFFKDIAQLLLFLSRLSVSVHSHFPLRAR